MFCAMAISVVGCSAREGGSASPRRAAPAKLGLDDAGRMRPGADDRCPVCAMGFSEERPFLSAIVEGDGATHYFCGTGCMIKSWMHPEVYLGTTREALSKAVVREYFGGAHVDGSTALFVAGSDVTGPMGPALVPLKNRDDLETFRRRHGGKTVFRLSEMDDDRWRAVTGKQPLPADRR